MTFQFQANGFASVANKKGFYDHYYILDTEDHYVTPILELGKKLRNTNFA